MNNLSFPSVKHLIPVGSIISYAGNVANGTLPREWLLCDGSAVEISQYYELYLVIGDLYGKSKTTFNLPDYSGQFLRSVGFDDAAHDNRRTVTGVGSIQNNDFQTHQHTHTGATIGATISGTSDIKVSQDETRPAKTFVNYLIKARCSYEE